MFRKLFKGIRSTVSAVHHFFAERYIEPQVLPPEHWFAGQEYDPSDPSQLNWATFPIGDDDAQAHFMAVGTTGSAKTIILRLLMQSVLPDIGTGRQIRALVYDAKQDALSVLSAIADPRLIFTLNPFDDRGVAWDLAKDITEPRVALELAYTLVPQTNEQNPYFADASRDIIYGIILSFILSKQAWSLADVIRASSNPKTALRVLKRHKESAQYMSTYFNKKQTCIDVFSTIATKLLAFRPVAGCWEAATRRISLTEFFNREMILVLGNCEESKKSMEAINRLIFKRATEIQLAKPEYPSERTWYFLDELTEAGKLEGLVSLMKKGRSKGARVAIAFQTISGLRDPSNYGQYIADEIVGQVGCRFFGRIECPETAEFASKTIGEKEFIQKSNSHTYGQYGSSTYSYQNIISRTVLPSEFLSMPACTSENGLFGIVTLRNIGCTTIHVHPVDLFEHMLVPPEPHVPDFVPRDVAHQYMPDWTPEQREQFAPAPKKGKDAPPVTNDKPKPKTSKSHPNLDDLLG